MKNAIVQVRQLTAQYGARTILKALSFEIYAGEIFMITGGSGSGKTTLLNHMIGLLEPLRGTVLIDHTELIGASAAKRLSILKKIGVMYQQGALFKSMSLLDNIKLPLEELTTLPRDAIDIIAHNKLKMVGLGEFGHYMPATISGGMQKRVALARAMALDPKILFLDEPSAGLDPITSRKLDQLMLNLSHTLGITFVIISHELSSIEAIAQRVILLYQGEIAATGTPAELRTHRHKNVKRFFNREWIGEDERDR